jgi:hypothetical protein
MRGSLFEHGLVLADGLPKLVLLQALARPIEMFVNVLCHGKTRVPRVLRACWGSPSASFAARSSRVPIFSRGSNFHYIPDAKPPSKRIQPSVLRRTTKDCGLGADRSKIRKMRISGRRDAWRPPSSYARAPARAWLGNSFTFSRMDFSDNPLRTRPTKPRKINGMVSARNAKNEKLVAVVFST